MRKNRSQLRESRESKRLSPQFKEKIMLAVTSVNECRYCEWGHSIMALNHGCTDEEIDQIMQQNFGSCDPDEVVALSYAQHFAETGGIPTEEAKHKLLESYGEQKAQDIQLAIDMITIGNLLGNTLDAFESRFKGLPPENGSLLFEFILYSIGFPFIILMKLKMKKKKK
jgi:AhpD family alkylhydroperoxidase